MKGNIVREKIDVWVDCVDKMSLASDKAHPGSICVFDEVFAVRVNGTSSRELYQTAQMLLHHSIRRSRNSSYAWCRCH